MTVIRYEAKVLGPPRDKQGRPADWWIKPLQDRLSEPMSIEFEETPWREALSLFFIMRSMSVIMVGPPKDLERENVTLKAHNVLTGLVLERILLPVGLAFGLKDGAIFIASEDEIAGLATTRSNLDPPQGPAAPGQPAQGKGE